MTNTNLKNQILDNINEYHKEKERLKKKSFLLNAPRGIKNAVKKGDVGLTVSLSSLLPLVGTFVLGDLILKESGKIRETELAYNDKTKRMKNEINSKIRRFVKLKPDYSDLQVIQREMKKKVSKTFRIDNI